MTVPDLERVARAIERVEAVAAYRAVLEDLITVYENKQTEILFDANSQIRSPRAMLRHIAARLEEGDDKS